MLKKFAFWFTCFGLSFLIQSLGWTEQGKAFLYINIGGIALIVLVYIVILMITGLTNGYAIEAGGFSFLSIFFAAIIVSIKLLTTLGATKIFDVDFYVAFQIMSFGQCLCNSNINNKNDD